MQSGESDRSARGRRFAVKEDDLEELYLLVQGAPYANTVLDAQASLAQKDLETTLELLESARDRYEQSNRRILRQDLDAADDKPKKKPAQKEARRLKQKQDRCKSVLAIFDDLIATLRRMIRLHAKENSSAADTDAPTTAELLKPGSTFRAEYETARSTRVQLAVIRRYCAVELVQSSEDLVADELYFLSGKEHTYLIQLPDVNEQLDEFPVRLALSGQRMQSLHRDKLLDMGRRKRLIRLIPRAKGDTESAADAQVVLEKAVIKDRAEESSEVGILDMGDFSQLHDAAVRSGLVPSTDMITHVRDREFRLGDFQRAFQILEGLFGKFTAAATQREQRLRREDLDIASGKVRMSPKALKEKRARDTAESQLVNRARGRFLRVLEGLRVMMRQLENPKSEVRNSKQIRNQKPE